MTQICLKQISQNLKINRMGKHFKPFKPFKPRLLPQITQMDTNDPTQPLITQFARIYRKKTWLNSFI
jgi:hypothetical protein